MALLGRVPARRRPEAEPEAEAPKLRRADAHPDAPARRPLLARDLGEPLDLEDFPEAPAEDEPAFAETEHRPLPGLPGRRSAGARAAAQAEPGLAEPETQRDEPEPQWTGSEPEWAEAEPEPEPEIEWQPAAQAGPVPITQLAAQLPEAEEEESDQSLSQLVNRIEFGLSRKRQALPASAELPPVEETQDEQEKVGHRLRSAINDLQKIASSGG